MRYFECKTGCFTNGTNTWEDSSFIVATANSIVIDSVLSDLSRPITLRKMIAGAIDTGDGGYNHNASHVFLWHFIEDKWQLTDLAIEICDACPTYVDACVSCFIEIRSFCPWSSYIAREINLLKINELLSMDSISVYPNPVADKLYMKNTVGQRINLSVLNLQGQEIENLVSYDENISLDLSAIPNGIYFVKINSGKNNSLVKILIGH